MQMYFAKICGFSGVFDQKISNFRQKRIFDEVTLTIICDAYRFQLREFSKDNSLGTKIDFEFSSKNLLFSINDFAHLSEISFYICSARQSQAFSGR